jgi:hypothetical protein
MPAPRLLTLRLLPLDSYPADLARWLEEFETGRYRASLDPLEAYWFPIRDDFGKGLIQLTVAMNQISTTDLTVSPRALLIGARRLLKPYLPAHEGVDVDAARRLAERELRRLRRRKIPA